MSRWYDDPLLVKSLGNALVEAEVLETAADYNDFLRKPNQYNSHYENWERNGYPESDSDNGWEEFVDSFNDDESEEDDENESDETE